MKTRVAIFLAAVLLVSRLYAPPWQTNSPSATPAAAPALSYRDPASGIIFYVESDGHHVVALDKDGKVLWRRTPGFEDQPTPPPKPDDLSLDSRIMQIGPLGPQELTQFGTTNTNQFISITIFRSGFNTGVLDKTNGDYTPGLITL